MTSRAISIVTYNRAKHIGEVVEGIFKTKPNNADVFVCDDGSTDNTSQIITKDFPQAIYLKGPNSGVVANKNRALFLMRNHHFSAIIEDDLVAVDKDWFNIYEGVAILMDVHHFCRVQNKTVPENRPGFSEYVKQKLNATPIYGLSPRGDFTFITRKVITTVGGLNTAFKGAGYAHGEWSSRVINAGLVSHPNGWIDIIEARDRFIQVGDTEGGRWGDDQEEVKKQIRTNKRVARKLNESKYTYFPLRIT